jgi:uncharacterized protein (TIGR03083 family)
MTVQTLLAQAAPIGAFTDAAQIAPLAHAEAAILAAPVLARFLSLLDKLEPEDWDRPTVCSEWTVRDMVAHQAGAYASGARFADFRRQWMRLPARGRSVLDTVNAFQIAERAGRTPAELIAELRDVGPKAIAARGRMSPVIRSLPIPVEPLGLRRVGYVSDELYIRDTFIHTADICLATNRPVTFAPDPDSRIVALIVRDLAQRLPGSLGGRTVAFDLTGLAGGCFRIGPASAPAATLHMSMLDFNLRASGRMSADDALARTQVAGDAALAQRAIEHTMVVY